MSEINGSRRRPARRIAEAIASDGEMRRDPAENIPGMPPNFGRFPVGHVVTFQGFVTNPAQSYMDYDEAVKDSLDNARYMRNDCGVMECVEARQRAVALLDWHLEPEDDNSQSQKDLCEALTQIIQRIPRFTEYRYNLMHAIWYGRYAIQHRYGWVNVRGHKRLMPKRERENVGWLPISGDKLVFRQDDWSRMREGQWPNQLGIRIGAAWAARHGIGAGDLMPGTNLRVEATQRGLAYFLPEYERKLVAVHKHLIEDGQYEDPMSAGMIHGVGIRSRIYWDWVQKQESLAFLMEYLERSAGGIELWRYPQGNSQAKAEAEEAAKNRTGGRNQLLVPVPMGEDGFQYGVEIIEPGMAGIDTLQSLLNEYYGHRIKRYILGQTLSSEAAATGLGSGVAELHFDSFLQIIKYDAANLEETITNELVAPLKRWNFPEADHIHVRFVIETEDSDQKERLEAIYSAWQMGARVKEQDVFDTIGLSAPTDDDKVLMNPQITQAEMMQGMAEQGKNPFAMGQVGESMPDPPSPEQVQKELEQNLASAPLPDEGGEHYVKEGEEWVAREVPEFDTGDRKREQ